VAKEAADLVLLNGNFSIIVTAIREGRRIIDNLRKIAAYLLGTSFSELFIVAASLAIGGPLPLLSSQILWTNIIEEGFMNFAFAFEPGEDGAMKRAPEKRSGSALISREMKYFIAVISIVTGLFLILLYLLLLHINLPIERLRTIMFVALSVDSIFFSFSLKNLHAPLWRTDFFSNRYLLVALSISLGLLLAAIFTAPIRTLLSLVPLTAPELLFLLGIGLFNLATIEAGKWIVFQKHRTKKIRHSV
jgi:P-type Ca2+ transporter type 2C